MDQLRARGVVGSRSQELASSSVLLGVGIGGKIMLSRQPVSVVDYARDPSLTRDLVDLCSHREGIRGMLGVPLECDGEVVGVLSTGVRSYDCIGDRVRGLVVEFARSLVPLIGAPLQSATAVRLAVEEERMNGSASPRRAERGRMRATAGELR